MKEISMKAEGMRVKKEEKIRRRINELASVNGAKVTHFKYYKEIFGNLEVTLEYSNQSFVIVTDRGEIYCNHKLIYDSSYHIAGADDTVEKALEVIASVCTTDKPSP